MNEHFWYILILGLVGVIGIVGVGWFMVMLGREERGAR